MFHMPEESKVALTSKQGQTHKLKDIIGTLCLLALFVSFFVGSICSQVEWFPAAYWIPIPSS